MQTVWSVPKTYAGVRFRSTLEADWAANLDHYRIVWEYEPEALALPSGALYRPDFYLPELTTWLEVKGPHNERIGKTKELTDATQCEPLCAHDDYCWGIPWRLVVIGRSPISGRIVWESFGRDVALARCVCRKFSFRDETGSWICRACGIDGKDGRALGVWEPGRLAFLRAP